MPVKICKECDSSYGGFVFFSDDKHTCPGCAQEFREENRRRQQRAEEIQLEQIRAGKETKQEKERTKQEKERTNRENYAKEQEEKTKREIRHQELAAEVRKEEERTKQEEQRTKREIRLRELENKNKAIDAEVLKEKERTKQKELDVQKATIAANNLDKEIERMTLQLAIKNIPSNTRDMPVPIPQDIDESGEVVGVRQRPWTTTHAILDQLTI